MRPRLRPVLLAVSLAPHALASNSPYAASVEDLFAFPKFAVRFLNGLPIDNSTALRWLDSGLPGGLAQFLEQPSLLDRHHSDSLASRAVVTALPAQSTASAAGDLQLMRMGPSKSYLCHIPPPPPIPPSFSDDDLQVVPAAKSWKQLAALSGTCLYHRQGWFTYSYCHNLHVRQFREVAQTQPLAGMQIPEEDSEWEAFTLGRSPTADLNHGIAISEENALAQDVEVARGARQRYLVQRWGDGTICDKTGRQREIEVQFHCSTTTMDAIMFVKETSTCKYVLVIHTPRLCGEPGFKSRAEQSEEAIIRCREIVDDSTIGQVDRSLPDSSHPRRRSHGRPALTGAKPGANHVDKSASEKKDPVKTGVAVEADKISISMLKKIIEGMVLGGSKDAEVAVVGVDEDDKDSPQYWIVEGDENIFAHLTQPVASHQEESAEEAATEAESGKDKGEAQQRDRRRDQDSLRHQDL